MSEKLKLWQSMDEPPKGALKQIGGGRLKGMTDVNPLWRIMKFTEIFGAIGEGWYYERERLWTEQAVNEIAAFAEIKLYYKLDNGEWSAPVYGIGGSAFSTMEKNGMYMSDECYKMAITDALSVAMKQLGCAAKIYMGLWDGSKYSRMEEAPAETPAPKSANLKAKQKQLVEIMMKLGDGNKELAKDHYYILLADHGIEAKEHNELTLLEADAIIDAAIVKLHEKESK